MKYLFFILLILITNNSFGQVNLVPNYSFEYYTSCPPGPGNAVVFAYPWFIPTLASPDYFNSCTSAPGGDVPDNFAGFQYAKTGEAYVGISACEPTLRDSGSEYISCPLSKALSAGKKYCVSFYVSLSNGAKYAIDALGAYLSKDSIYDSTPYSYFAYQPQISNPASNMLSDTLNWMLITGEFIAEGGEKIITIGNFKKYSDLNFTSVNPTGGSWAYYYIDDVSVTLVHAAEAGNDVVLCKGDSLQIGTTAEEGVSYSWFPTTGLNYSNIAQPIASPDITTTYYLIQMQELCGSQTDSITITVKDCEQVIFVPTGFSPNGDGQNDMLFVRGKNIKSLSFYVYDRWGELVFSTAEINTGWDGVYKGKAMSTQVFMYYLKAIFEDDTTFSQKGDVTLVR